jgi:single-stranded-DNA-specific exonuclease
VPPRLDIPPCETAAVDRLRAELELGEVLAQVLVRRGLGDVGAARAFLAAGEAHPPAAFDGIERAVALVLEHVEARTPIVVHGDYDVDGVCSTAILVRALRALGAEVGWFLPSRVDDGYGLSAATVERLSVRGTRLLITVDCAITAVDEVALARAAGMDVVVTDHHTPRADGVLPDAPIVHPVVSGYPCADLCAAAVAHKLAAALFEASGRDPAEADADLDLVGLATLADVVPLRGENRRLARAGLKAMARTAKPGLRALMKVARVDPSGLDAHAAVFRLAPRINAAGRLYRADAGVELALTKDEERAKQIAAELDAANHERRAVEERTRFEAERQVAEQKEAHPAEDGPFAFVLAHDDWHPGVVGIVASRIAERHHRPVVLIALDGGTGSGSGRSIPGFDLLGGLRACGELLERFGGHRAAAGLEIRRERIDAFRAAFDAHAASVLTPEDLVARERIDAVVPGDALGVELAEELARLEPCGAGNPSVNLLVPAATLEDPRQIGEGRHVRFSLSAGGTRVKSVCFGSPRLPAKPGVPVDATVRLSLNEWNGAIEPQIVLRSARPCDPAPIEVLGEPTDFLAAALAELDAPLPDPIRPSCGDIRGEAGRSTRDRRGAGIAGTIGALVASGEPVLVVCADVPRRLRKLQERLGGFTLCSHATLRAQPSFAEGFAHVVVMDPPLVEVEAGAATVHLAWGPSEIAFAQRVAEEAAVSRDGAASLYRALRDGAPLEAALRAAGSAQRAGRLLRVLAEVDLVVVDRAAARAHVPPPERKQLAHSAAFRSYTREYEEGLRSLGESTARAA